jgi:hypothetical protein
MAHSNKTSITLNIQQNQSDFELEDLEEAPIVTVLAECHLFICY